MGAAKSLSSTSTMTFPNINPYWTLWRSNTPVHQYIVYTQKQINLINSLLQDIAVFNEYDCTKLEDWLTDIEMAVDLTNESWAKLA